MKFKNSAVYEAMISVLPITILILIINFCLAKDSRMNIFDLTGFGIGNILLIVGMALYGKGTKISLTPIGDAFGSYMTMKKKIWFMMLAGLVLGFLITFAEPSLNVMGEQLGADLKWKIIIAISLGVGIYLAIAMLLPLLKWDFTLTIMIMYAAVFIIALFINQVYTPLSFDAGGVTTGALTVPFILALSASVAGTLGGKKKDENSFGMIAICSVGPILTTFLFCVIFPDLSPDTQIETTQCNHFSGLFTLYGNTLFKNLKEVLIALSPIAILFFIFNFFAFKLPKTQLLRIMAGLFYAYIGLALFLTGVGAAYMGIGYSIGENLSRTLGKYKWLLLPIVSALGMVIALAEPAVGVLVKQVEEISSGMIKRNAMKLALAASMALALFLSFLRILTGISIWYIIGFGYIIALGLSFFVPKVYTSIAFDSGGVASGPMTSSFLLPFAIGATNIIQNGSSDSVLELAYGLVATVALMPLITVQLVGLIATIKQKRIKKCLFVAQKSVKTEDYDDIIELG